MTTNVHRDRTEVKADIFTYEWEIHNFNLLLHDNGSALESKIFEMGSDKIQWKLSLYPRGDNTYGSDGSYTGIFLHLVSNGTAPLVINVRCEILMLTTNGILSKADFIHNYSSLQPQNGWSLYQKREVLLNACKSGDALTVKCRIERPMAIETKTAQRPMIFDLEKHRLADDCLQLIKEPNQFNDVTLLVDDEKFPAHKIFLATRSPVFAAMFTHGELKENVTNEVKIEDADPEVVQAMLEFIYSDEVTNLPPLARRLIATAHKYELERLKTMCEESLCTILDTENAGEIIMLADLYGSPELVQFVIDFIADNFRDVAESKGYSDIQSPELLQRLLVSVALKKM